MPVNSKKALAGIRHRLLSAKWRPSDRKLNTGPPRPVRWEAEIHLRKFDIVSGGAHHRSHIVNLNVVSLREIELALMGRNAKL